MTRIIIKEPKRVGKEVKQTENAFILRRKQSEE